MFSNKIHMMLCDVDGTLLKKGYNTISNEALTAIQFAVNNGIHFVIASGRCYSDLCTLFSAVKNQVIFVACDGGVAVHNGQTLYTSVIPGILAELLLDSTEAFLDITSIIYTKDDVYCIGNDKPNIPCKQVSSLSEVCGNIYKVAFYNLPDFAKQKIRSFATRSAKLTEVYHDSSWIEFVSAGTDKGAACKALQKQFGISKSETAAFGDNTNDFGMLRQAQITYASSSAIPDIKRMCKYTCKDIPNEIIKLSQERGTL